MDARPLTGPLAQALGAQAGDLLGDAVGRELVVGGTQLFQQGEPGDALFIVEHGRLRAVQEDGAGRRRVLGDMGRGDIVGELSLLTGEPRRATVEAVRDTWLWRLPKEAFDRLVERSPRASLALARVIAQRAHAPARPHVPPPATLTLLPCGRGALDMRALRGRLVTALAPLRPCVIDRHIVERLLGPKTADSTLSAQDDPLGRLLDDIEGRYPLVVYVADEDDQAWTWRVLRQADRILRLVCGEDPGLSPLEERLSKDGALSPTAREELVRVLPDDALVPSGTEAWLAARAMAAHHHVRLGVPRDFARLARLVTGRPIGLALSGGGARGTAHIGLLRALGEADVPVDTVAGTSAGAFVAALFARNDDPDAIAASALEFARAPLFDPTLPLVSLLAGHRFNCTLRRIFGDARLEDVWRPCFVTSADLATAEMVVHDCGPVWLAVRASGSVPAVVPPVPWGERLLVDGGVLNNLPVDVVRARSVDPLVIASDVSDPSASGWTRPRDAAMSGWRVLFDRLRGRPTPPRLGDLIVRASTLAATRHFATVGVSETDLYVRLPVDGFATFDGKNVKAMMDVGYDRGRRVVDEWIASGRLPRDGWVLPRAAP
jgi:NTE family protein